MLVEARPDLPVVVCGPGDDRLTSSTQRVGQQGGLRRIHSFLRTTGNGILPLALLREPGTPLRFIFSAESAAPELFEPGNEPFYAVALLV